MILAVAMLLSILVGFLRGGRLGALTSLPVRWGALAVGAFALQTFFIYQKPTLKVAGEWGWQEGAFLSSYVLLLLTAWANRRLPGMLLIGLGLLLNFAVMAVNGGWMPITPEALSKVGLAHLAPTLASGMRVYSSKDVILPRGETRLWFLSDIFVLAKPFPVPAVFCVGDIACALGALVLLQNGMLRQGVGDSSQGLAS
jgi:hypothetical protein